MKFRSVFLALAFAVGLLLVAVPCMAAVDVVRNGGFEEGFEGGVATGWTPFNNGGRAAYGYAGEESENLVYEGNYSQLIQIHTRGQTGSDSDRYSGIYQVVDVVPGQRYMFSFYGMARSTEGTQAESGYGYRIQVGYDFDGGTDPWSVTDWREMDRWAEYPLDTPGIFQSHARGVTPTSDKLTIFIRAWKKFPSIGQEARFNLDAVSLLGPDPGTTTAAAAAPEEAESESAPASETTEAAESLPDTGGGSLLPLLGIALGVSALGLTGTRLLRRR